MISAERLGWTEPDHPEPVEEDPRDTLYGLPELWGSVLRSWILLGLVLVGGIVAAYVTLKRVPSLYAANATIGLDIRQMLSLNDRLDPTTGMPKVSLVGTQMALMRSDANLLAVVDKLKLDAEPAFGAVPALGAVQLKPASPDADPRARRRLAIVQAIQDRLLVERVQQTYVVLIQYMSDDPVLGARVANAIADQYLADQLNARYDATLRAGSWIEQHLDDLKRQASDAGRAVEAYRREAGLVSTGGRSIRDRELVRLTELVVTAMHEMAQATQRLARITVIRAGGDALGNVADAQDDRTIVSLRKLYVEASARLAALQPALDGSPDEVLAPLRRQIANLHDQIDGEVARLSDRYEASYQASLFKFQDLQRSVAKAREVAVQEGIDSVRLRELERSAQVMNDAYGNFLRGYLQLTQKNAFPTSEARILSRAAEATGPDYPARSLVLLNGILASAIAAVALALRRSAAHQAILNPADIVARLAMECLAVVRAPWRRGRALLQEGLRADVAFTRAAMDALTLSSARRPGPGGRVIGVLQSFNGGVGSSVAEGFAQTYRERGNSVLLLTMAGPPRGGPADAAPAEPEPGVLVSRHTDVAGLPQVLREARRGFDVVVLDAPPLSHPIECRAAARLADGLVLGVERGARQAAMIRSVIQGDEQLPPRLIGAVLCRDATSGLDRFRHLLPEPRRLAEGFARLAARLGAVTGRAS